MNRAVPIILLLALLLMLWGYLFVYKFDFGGVGEWKIKSKQSTPVTYEEKTNQENAQAEKDAENYNAAIKEKRLNLCENIIDSTKKSDCRDMIGASQALQENDPDLCTTLTNSGIMERCHDNIAYFRAEEKWDTSLCGAIQDETIKSQCINSIDESKLESHIASGTLDVSFCETISDKTMMEDCKRKIATEKDSEFYREAIANSAVTSCEKIEDMVTKSKCKDAVLFDLAVKEGNLDYCSNIVDKERSDYCRKSLLGRQDISRYQQYVRTGNLESCNELTVIQMKNQCRDTIIFAKVRETRDEALCDLLYNTGITTQCRELLSKGQGN